MFGLRGLAAKIFGTTNDRKVTKYKPRVDEINALEPALAALSDAELRARTQTFKDEVAAGKSLDDLLVPAFATVREAAKRTLGLRHFDVQLIGGMVLHEGMIAEMKTGEGKTLVATLAVYLNALAGKGVHVVTVNDYLASRDADWMGQIYGFLGLTTGVIVHGLSDERAPGRLCQRRHLRHQQRTRLRLSARQHEVSSRARWYSAGTTSRSSTRSTRSWSTRRARRSSSPARSTTSRISTTPSTASFRSSRRKTTSSTRSSAPCTLTEKGNEHLEQVLGAAGLLKGEQPLRCRERDHRASRAAGAARPQAVPARQGLHRQGRPGHHHRRVHRPHDAGPALFGRPAPGAGGQGARGRSSPRTSDARLHHLPELLPPLRQARRHDRHGLHRSRRVHGHLQARRDRDPDQRAGGTHGRGRPGLSHRPREIRRHHRRHQRGPRTRSAGARRHHLDREVGTAFRHAEVQGGSAQRAQRPLSRAGSGDHRPRPACRAP